MENSIENMDTIGVIDSDIIDAIKTIRCHNEKRPDECNILNYLSKSYPDCNVTTIRQRITYLENKNKIWNKPHDGKNPYCLIDDSAIILDDSSSPDDPQSIPLLDMETPRVNPIKEQVTLIHSLNEKLFSLSIEITALKSYVLEQVFLIKKATVQDIQERPNNKETNNGYGTSLTDQIYFLKKENKTKNIIIQILSDKESCLSKQWEKQEFIFPKKVSPEKIKSNTPDLTTANEFSVLARENISTLQPPSLTIHLQEQSCIRKKATPLRQNMVTPNNDKKSEKQNKCLSKRKNDSSRKISNKKEMEDKNFRKSRNVTIILGDSVIKDVKGN